MPSTKRSGPRSSLAVRAEINDSFLDWLSRRRADRPFFAFLNYFDAHDPFIPPAGFENQFGIPPSTATGLPVSVRLRVAE